MLGQKEINEAMSENPFSDLCHELEHYLFENADGLELQYVLEIVKSKWPNYEFVLISQYIGRPQILASTQLARGFKKQIYSFWKAKDRSKASFIKGSDQFVIYDLASDGQFSEKLVVVLPNGYAEQQRLKLDALFGSSAANKLKKILAVCSKVASGDDRKQVSILHRHSTVPTVVMTKQGRVLLTNEAFLDLTGYSLVDIQETPLSQTILRGINNNSELKELNTAISSRLPWTGVFSIYSKYLGVIQVHLCAVPFTFKQGEDRVLVQLFDISSFSTEKELLYQLAYYDAATGLPNRSTLRERLSVASARALSEGFIGALMFIDLDHFTKVVDVYGHHHGDNVVKYITQIVNAKVGEKGSLFRLGGDEIAVLIPQLSKTHRDAQILAIEFAESIRKLIEQPFEVNDIQHYVTASVGVVTFPKSLEGTEDILREADTALHGAKNNGRNSSMLFHTAMYQAIRLKCEIEAGVRNALIENQFLIYIQPQVNREQQWCSAEILIRWLHPEKGMVSPAEFIPVAEDTGQIIQIGHWVLQQSIAFLSELQNLNKPIPLSINISAHQIKESSFVEQVLHLIDQYEVDPNLLTLEITESLLLSDFQKANAVMYELSKFGISFSIDDFGTGYSNLGYLRHLPVKELKIDRSFIAQVMENSQDAILVQSLISLGHQLSLEVVAEGVETKQQADYLVSLNCERIQGYLYSKPISLAQFKTQWLQQ